MMKCKNCGKSIEQILEKLNMIAGEVKRPIIVIGEGLSRDEVVDDEELTTLCDLIDDIEGQVSSLELVLGVLSETRIENGQDPELWAFNFLGALRQGMNDSIAQLIAHIKVGRKHPMIEDAHNWKNEMA